MGFENTSAFSVALESKGIGGVLNYLKFSSRDKMLQITTYDLRFIQDLKTKLYNFNDYRNGDLSTSELFASQEQ